MTITIVLTVVVLNFAPSFLPSLDWEENGPGSHSQSQVQRVQEDV